MAGNWSDLYEPRRLIGILRFYERAWNPRARPRNYLLTYARLNRIGSNRILRDPNEVWKLGLTNDRSASLLRAFLRYLLNWHSDSMNFYAILIRS